MKTGSDCEVLLGKNRLWWEDQKRLKTCLESEAVWLYRRFAGAIVGGYTWDGLCYAAVSMQMESDRNLVYSRLWISCVKTDRCNFLTVRSYY